MEWVVCTPFAINAISLIRIEYLRESFGRMLPALGIDHQGFHSLRARQVQALLRAQDEDRLSQNDTLLRIGR